METESARPGLGHLARRQWGVVTRAQLVGLGMGTKSGRLRPEDVTVRHGNPVTTLARTLLDLADVLEPQALKRVITEAEYTNQFDLTAITAAVQNNPGRASAKLMAAVGGAGHRTRSELEDRFLALLDRHGVEPPQTGVWIEGYELDFHMDASRPRGGARRFCRAHHALHLQC